MGLTHDVVVIGGGPAGSMAAWTLARAGARVALVDGSHPREKPCGGGVTGRALALTPASIFGGHAIDLVSFEAAGRSASIELRDPETLRVFSRAAFDAALFDGARAAGADIVPERVRSFDRERGAWTVQTSSQMLRAPWLAGADGAGGIVRKQVFRPFGRDQLSIAAGSFVDDVRTGEITIAFVDRPSGYLWAFPRESHLAAGTCAQADVTSTAEMHAITDAWLDGYPPARGRPRRRYAWPIPSLASTHLDVERPAGDGWLLLGDAAGLVDPITREGIFFAMRSGILAADSLGRPRPERHYAEAVRDEMHAELRRAARLKAGFYRPRFTRLLIEALERSPAIQRVMVDLVAGRQPYAGVRRRLMATFEIGLMLRVLGLEATKPGDMAS